MNKKNITNDLIFTAILYFFQSNQLELTTGTHMNYEKDHSVKMKAIHDIALNKQLKLKCDNTMSKKSFSGN